MANTSSALKAMRTAERRRIRNRSRRSALKTALTKARKASDASEPTAAVEATRSAIRQLDIEVTRGIIHRNNAARRKSRLMRHLNALTAH